MTGHMATLVCFHAHPDDECIATGGVMAQAAAAGHRVVLVVATRGELGEVPDGLLADGEHLWERRVAEVEESAALLGAVRCRFLGYKDSGMIGTPDNDAPESFWQADVEEAADRLAHMLREERADVLTVYYDHGVYGHPDHIQVHRVGKRAAELAGVARVYEATIDRDRIAELSRLVEAGEAPGGVTNAPQLPPDFGSPAALITTRVDVTDFAAVKRQAMRVHASQIPEDSFFLALPDEAFEVAFGLESFIRVGAPPGTTEDSLFAGLDELRPSTR
jgi:LmbE family N-acetylglucosaminyl deacetylase